MPPGIWTVTNDADYKLDGNMNVDRRANSFLEWVQAQAKMLNQGQTLRVIAAGHSNGHAPVGPPVACPR